MKNAKYLSLEAIADGSKSGLSEKDMRALGMWSPSADEMQTIFRADAEGYIIPYNDHFCRAKILSWKSKFGVAPKQKYTQLRDTPPQLYLPNIGKINWDKVATDTAQPLIITEGEKKAAAACKAGYACIGLGGVWCFRSKVGGFLKDWDKFKLDRRKIYIVYDSDIVDKIQVRCAEYALAVELIARGATAVRVRLPESLPGMDKVGLDDFLVAHGLPNNIGAARAAFDQLPQEKIDPASPPHLTDLGNAIRLEQYYKHQLRFVPYLKSWIVCDAVTGLWQTDEDGQAMRCAKTIPYNLRKESERLRDDDVKAAFHKWANQSESASRLNAILTLASTESGLVINRNALDSDPWSLAFKNGTVMDLRSGQARKIVPEDFLMNFVAVEYDPKAKCPQWDKFLLDVMNDDKALVKFLQRAVGLSLTGDMSEQCFFILYGTGANGKSTFLNTLLELFGKYGRQASPQTFMAQKFDSAIRSDLVRLVGVRFIATSETENYQRIAESLIKQWTGGEQISTRDLYEKTFEFAPQGKLWLATNHKPRIYSTDHAIWRRVMLVPFTRTFKGKQKDLSLANKLKEELPGILNWALEGCKDWREGGGLRAPKSVTEEVSKYRADMDAIGSWIEEKCEIGKGYKELLGTLFNNYRAWAESAEEYIFSKREFSQHMKERGFGEKQTTVTSEKQKGRFLTGIQLLKPPQAFSASQPRNPERE